MWDAVASRRLLSMLLQAANPVSIAGHPEPATSLEHYPGCFGSVCLLVEEGSVLGIYVLCVSVCACVHVCMHVCMRRFGCVFCWFEVRKH